MKKFYTNNCPNCPNIQLPSQHILSCQEIQARLFKISPKDLEDLRTLLRLPKLSSTASERSKASVFINLHIMDKSTTTLTVSRRVSLEIV
ncbi:hypothetical protein TNCV_548681 [Trichonephila clavipes]|nr:hypothetical protein TNCV_548681 [Trichonephila clavipes]